MHLEYTNRTSGFTEIRGYRNPEYFQDVEHEAEIVTLDGDFPEIKAAYEAAGVTVEVVADKAKSDDKKPRKQEKDSIL